MSISAVESKVFLVGAGPGNLGLLTLRAAELLAIADLVLYDQLVPRRVLDLANPEAEKVCVRELPGQHPDKYPQIHTLMIESARQGKRVVRLKGGDPLIFGRGGEEAEALRKASIPYEIVPGVSAALAAAAYLDLPLTHRHYSSAVAFVTGHEMPGKPGNKLDWKVLAAFPGTLAIYKGITRLPLIINELLKHGKDPQTPAAIVERASTGDMRAIESTLADLEDARRNAGLESPGLILVGEAVSRRTGPSWYEKRPLFGKRVLVTRPRHQANSMLRRLEDLGAVPYSLPTIEIREPADYQPLDSAIAQLRSGTWQWLVFTSTNGVEAFFCRLARLGRDLRDLGSVKLAAIGPRTADALREYHLHPDLVPDSTYSSEGLVESLKDQVKGQRVLLLRANRGRELLREQLSHVANVDQVVVYEQVDSVDEQSEVMDALRRGEIQYITLTSSNIARSLLKSIDETIRHRIMRSDVQLVAISPETGKAIRELGFPVACEASRYTTDGIIESLIDLSRQTSATSQE